MASRHDITILRQEAGSAGNHELVALCDQALDGCDKSHPMMTGCRICCSTLHAWAVSADASFTAGERLQHLYCVELAKFERLQEAHRNYNGATYGRQFFTGALEQWIVVAALGLSLGILSPEQYQ